MVAARHPDFPPFYVWSKEFTPLSGGRVCLHLLCDLLNKVGMEAYITAKGVSGALYTPQLTAAVFEAHKRAGRTPIVIYPEIVPDNPLRAARVVRYLLNKPGARGSRAVGDWCLKPSGKEFILHFADEFRVPDLASRLLYLPIHDRTVYHPPKEERHRSGFLVYSHRVPVSEDMIPAWARPYTLISMDAPRSPEEMAKLYWESEGLIAFERTGALHEALLCHCPSMGVPSDRFTEIPLFSLYGSTGIGWGGGAEELERSRATMPAFLNIYDAYAAQASTRLAAVLHEMKAHFGL